MKRLLPTLLLAGWLSMLGMAWSTMPVQAQNSCSASVSLVSLPPDALGVSRLPSIVLKGYADLVVTEVSLVDPSDVSFPLQKVREIETSECCASRLMFLSSKAMLAANTKYRVRVSIEDGNNPTRTEVLASFATGADVVTEKMPPPVDVHLVQVTLIDAQECDASHCEGQLELLVVDEKKAAAPSWLLVHSPDQDARPDSVFPLGQQALEVHVASTAFRVAPGACLEYEQVDVAGSTVAQDSLCKPDRCVAFDRGGVASEGCRPDSVRPIAWRVWSALNSDSCEDVPRLRIDAETGAPERVPAANHGGCSSGGRDSRTHGTAFASSVFVGLLVLRIRRRSRCHS